MVSVDTCTAIYGPAQPIIASAEASSFGIGARRRAKSSGSCILFVNTYRGEIQPKREGMPGMHLSCTLSVLERAFLLWQDNSFIIISGLRRFGNGSAIQEARRKPASPSAQHSCHYCAAKTIQYCETLVNKTTTDRPWHRLGADLFHFKAKGYLFYCQLLFTSSRSDWTCFYEFGNRDLGDEKLSCLLPNTRRRKG